MFEIRFNKWVEFSGFSYNETIDNVEALRDGLLLEYLEDYKSEHGSTLSIVDEDGHTVEEITIE